MQDPFLKMMECVINNITLSVFPEKNVCILDAKCLHFCTCFKLLIRCVLQEVSSQLQELGNLFRICDHADRNVRLKNVRIVSVFFDFSLVIILFVSNDSGIVHLK